MTQLNVLLSAALLTPASDIYRIKLLPKISPQSQSSVARKGRANQISMLNALKCRAHFKEESQRLWGF